MGGGNCEGGDSMVKLLTMRECQLKSKTYFLFILFSFYLFIFFGGGGRQGRETGQEAFWAWQMNGSNYFYM